LFSQKIKLNQKSSTKVYAAQELAFPQMGSVGIILQRACWRFTQ